VVLDAPVRIQVLELGLAFPPQQKVHGGAAAREQGLDQALADEARGSGDEVVHS
jgi:hypothetical protein